MEENNLSFFIWLSEKISQKDLKASTTELSESFGKSQQTISRWLKELEDQKLVKRVISSDGTSISLTHDGESFLKKYYAKLSNIFDSDSMQSHIKGKVTTGLGEGKYYMSLLGYRDQFQQLLGFDPYPGTLNIRLKDPGKASIIISGAESIEINGFETQERTFGPAYAYRAVIKGVEDYWKCAIISPKRTIHGKDTIELIAPDNLRDFFGLADGHEISIVIE